ncbi:MAG: prepilin peptidase [Candidatus Magasanikbacteria bacterium]|nr:prepilin peptidase [Candidatus Magasanikbacteria bacterium]
MLSVVFFPVLLITVLSIAVYTDLTRRQIPNWLTLGGLGLALIWSLLHGAVIFFPHLAGAALASVWLVFWRLGYLGGGDAKLMLAVGAILGSPKAIAATVYIALAGGMQAASTLFWHHYRHPAAGNRPIRQRFPFPYSLAIAAGSISAFFIPLPLLFRLFSF